MRAPDHHAESERLAALKSYGILDTPREADFDEIVALAAEICGTPMSIVSLVDQDRQWFKAEVGVEVDETSRDSSFCAHAILQEGIFEVADTVLDARFRDNPLVTGDPGLRFYAGTLLESEDGLPLGTLCVLDTEPRELTALQRKALRVLGNQVMTQLELRRKLKELDIAKADLSRADAQLQIDRDLLRLVTDRLPVRVAYIDSDYRYRFVNDGYKRQLGISEDELWGRTVADVLGEEIFHIGKPYLDRVFKGETISSDHVIPYRISTQRVQATYVPDFGPDGDVRGVVAHILDVTEQRKAAETLEKERARQNETLQIAQVATFDWDIENDRVFANALLAGFFGVSELDAKGGALSLYKQAIHQEDRDRVAEAIQRSVETGDRYEVEYRAIDALGRERNVLARGSRNLGEDGVTYWLSGVVLDITERVRALEALGESEDRRRLAQESAEIGVWNIDLSSLALRSDDRFQEIFSGKRGSFGYEDAFQCIHPEDRQMVRFRVEAACRPDDPIPYALEYRVLHEDGAVRWVYAQGRANYGRTGPKDNPVSFDGTILDITGRKQIEFERETLVKKLDLERSKLNSLFKMSPSAIAVVRGSDLVFEYANEAYFTLVGRTDILGKTLLEALPDLEGQGFDDLLRGVLTTGESYCSTEVPAIIQREGEPVARTIYVNLLYAPLEESGEEVKAIFVHAIDITDQVVGRREIERLADELGRQTALWDSALSSVSDLLFVFDEEVRFQYANRALLNLYGLELADILGKTCEDLAYPPEVSQIVNQDVHLVFDRGVPVANEVTYTSPTGQSGVFEYVFTPIYAPDGSVSAVAGSSRDVAARNAAQEALKVSQERLSDIAENVDQLVWTADSNGEIGWYNRRWYDYTGTTPEDMENSGWVKVQDPQFLSKVSESWAESVRSATPFEMEFPIRGADGVYRPFLTRANPIKDESGTVLRWFGTNTNIQSQKDAEAELERRVQERTLDLTRANRDLNEFSYSVAHDIRAPLRAIASTSRILIEDCGDRLTENERSLLDRQSRNAVRLAGIVDDLLAFARLAKSELSRESVDMTLLVQTTITETTWSKPGNACVFHVQADMTARGDRKLLGYAIMNLIDNACKFSLEGGDITIGYDGNAFFVKDEGIGFEMEYADKIFVAFERLVDQETFQGTGVGLANVKRIVERHGGRIWAESELGKGATFRFTLGSTPLIA